MFQSGVGDRQVAQSEILQLRQALEMFQPCVGHFRVLDHEVFQLENLQVTQSLEVFQVGVGDPLSGHQTRSHVDEVVLTDQFAKPCWANGFCVHLGAEFPKRFGGAALRAVGRCVDVPQPKQHRAQRNQQQQRPHAELKPPALEFGRLGHGIDGSDPTAEPSCPLQGKHVSPVRQTPFSLAGAFSARALMAR